MKIHSMHEVLVDVPGCAFCHIVAGRAPAEHVFRWPGVIAFRPLDPVTKGHVLVVPKLHVADALTDPTVTGMVMARAAELAAMKLLAPLDCNLITSVGKAATQSVFHLHVHIVPRLRGDGLALPWTSRPADGTPR